MGTEHGFHLQGTRRSRQSMWIEPIMIATLRGGHDAMAAEQQPRHQFQVLKHDARLEHFLFEQCLSENLVPCIGVRIGLRFQPISLPIGIHTVSQLQSERRCSALPFDRIFQEIDVGSGRQLCHQGAVSAGVQIVITINKRHIIPAGNPQSGIAGLAQSLVGLMQKADVRMLFGVDIANVRAVVRRTIVNQDNLHACNLLPNDRVETSCQCVFGVEYGNDDR